MRFQAEGMDDYVMLEVLNKPGWYGVECIRHFDIEAREKDDGTMGSAGFRMILKVLQGPEVKAENGDMVDPAEVEYEFSLALFFPGPDTSKQGRRFMMDRIYKFGKATNLDMGDLDSDELDGIQFDVNIRPEWDDYNGRLTEGLKSPYFAEFGTKSSTGSSDSAADDDDI